MVASLPETAASAHSAPPAALSPEPPLPPQPPQTPRSLPRRFGRYTLFDFIGHGGMAEIYLARARTALGAVRLCVVKQIAPEYAHNARFAEMLTYEAKLSARLSHANIVQVFDLGREGDQLYIAMEYVEGYDLNTLLRQCARQQIALPIEFALRMVAEALRGLDYAHRRVDDEGKSLGIVHRDVSPSNVLVSFEGEVKLCDFGIAHANDLVATADSVFEDAIKGKAGYMSPEHARGEGLDARADVFQVGVMLWELLAGRRMYRVEPGAPALLEQARSAAIPPLAARGLPEEARLYAIAARALAPRREDRYASAAAMLRELDAYERATGLAGSPLRFGDWLVKSFGTKLVRARRSRERATAALERGPAVVLTPLPPTAAPAPLPPTPAARLTGPSAVPLTAPSAVAPPPATATAFVEGLPPGPFASVLSQIHGGGPKAVVVWGVALFVVSVLALLASRGGL